MPAVRGDVDDAAPAALAHAGGRGPHQAHRRHHVQLPGGVPVLVGDVVEVAPAWRCPALLTSDVGGAEALLGRGEDALGGVGVGDVAGEGLGLAAGVLPGLEALVGGLDHVALGAGDEQDAGALGAEHPRGLAADAPAGAGDDAGAAVEPQVQAQPAVGLGQLEVVLDLHAVGGEGPVDRALAGDDEEPLALLVVSSAGMRDLGARTSAASRPCPASYSTADLDRADVPALAVGVHDERDRGAGGERGGEQLGRARALVACRRRRRSRRRSGGARGSRPRSRSPRGGGRRRYDAIGASSRSLRRPSNSCGFVSSAKRAIAKTQVGGAVEVGDHDLGAEALGRRGARRPGARRGGASARATSRAAESSVPPGITNCGGRSTWRM